jgi:hypothetical protein
MPSGGATCIPSLTQEPTRMTGLRLLLALGCLVACRTGRTADVPPNVIVVLVDDLGWKDLSCQGSDVVETPHVDRLAATGMRFTSSYAACTVCSPTRAAMLTGQYPARLHLTDWITGHERPHAKLAIPDWTQHLPLETVTVTERLKAAGYATAAIGKWHLGCRCGAGSAARRQEPGGRAPRRPAQPRRHLLALSPLPPRRRHALLGHPCRRLAAHSFPRKRPR